MMKGSELMTLLPKGKLHAIDVILEHLENMQDAQITLMEKELPMLIGTEGNIPSKANAVANYMDGLEMITNWKNMVLQIKQQVESTDKSTN